MAYSILKNKLSILTVAFAALMLVTTAAVPHHHHGAMMCMAVATCTHHEAHDHCTHHDAHHACTAHHDAGDTHAEANGHCAAELEYLVTAQQETGCKHFSCTLHHHPHLPFLPALFVLVNLSCDFAALPGGTHRYRPAVLLIESVAASQIHGLRAPPVRLTENG
jgi:hypothetical protein